ncbi:MAG: nucleoside monophosphate kinase, partial [Candidatus Liptonbacteria bacterium]
MRKIAIVLYAPPGGGKGTQAELLAKEFGLIHFDTGKYLESVVHHLERQGDSVIKRELKNFDTGMLMTPTFVYREVERAVKRIAQSGLGVVFSGSPRTIYEAERLIPLLEKLYGKTNIRVVELKVSPKDAVSRNSNRVLCSICHAPLLTKYYP